MAGGCSPAGVVAPEGDAPPPPVPDPYIVELKGVDNEWQVHYPDAAGRLAAGKVVPGGHAVHVPLDTSVVLVLRSTDYVYTLTVPQYGLKEIAVPDLEFRMEFRPAELGRFELVGSHLCGPAASKMKGQLVVEQREEVRAWLQPE